MIPALSLLLPTTFNLLVGQVLLYYLLQLLLILLLSTY